MKKLNYLLMSLIFFSSVIFYSCHTETPVNVDHESPEIESLFVYNVSNGDTLYLYEAIADSNGTLEDSTFIEFEQTIESKDGDINVELSVSDNGNLYNVTLIAQDAIMDSLVQLGSKRINSDGSLTFLINAFNFPAIQDSISQQFYLYFLISDDSENITNTNNSTKLGFNVEKTYIQEKLYNELGLLTNTEGDPIDFREKVEELTFFQFLAKG